MRKKLSFEEYLENLNTITLELESGELNLEESIKKYEQAMTYINQAKKIIDSAEGKLLKVSNNNNEIILENFKEGEDA